ncbi:endonuclease/exonuclease/phosphatase family protein [Euzebya tangerina]|uniref:endonuclease/exonuclease/phosphatase family protein n=1 Tax=Euzebya tangerina TaxID=591198 RepID=UPI000E318DA5|nr:endonuclease/exonuclease/phosphatase family protein [Euzebya tangerina]
MRVASANILHGVDIRSLERGQTELTAEHVDLEAVAAWLAQLDADVIALQEVDAHQERSGDVDQVAWLADRLGYDGRFVPALWGSPDTTWEEVRHATDVTSQPAYGVGLLSRVGLHDVQRTRLPYGGPGSREPGASPTNPGVDREPRVAATAVTDNGLRVATTHLSYMFWRAVPQLGHAIRAASVDHDGPSILIGDLNLPMWGGWLALHAWGLHPWRWPRLATTQNGWAYVPAEATYPAWNPRLQLDQIYIRRLSEPTAVQIGPAGPSDHLPVIVDLEM